MCLLFGWLMLKAPVTVRLVGGIRARCRAGNKEWKTPKNVNACSIQLCTWSCYFRSTPVISRPLRTKQRFCCIPSLLNLPASLRTLHLMAWIKQTLTERIIQMVQQFKMQVLCLRRKNKEIAAHQSNYKRRMSESLFQGENGSEIGKPSAVCAHLWFQTACAVEMQITPTHCLRWGESPNADLDPKLLVAR